MIKVAERPTQDQGARTEFVELVRATVTRKRAHAIVIGDALAGLEDARRRLVGLPGQAIWGTSTPAVRDALTASGDRVAFVPYLPVARPESAGYVTLIAVARGWLSPEEEVMCLVLSGNGSDMLLGFRPETEYPLTGCITADSMADPVALISVIDMAIAIGSVRHGRICGTMFTVGDAERVLAVSSLYPFEPFHGYPREARNVSDPALRTTLEKFACLDGAFVIAGDGTVEALVKTIHPTRVSDQIPGLGSRHAAAGGITASTNAYAVTVSESAGRVRVFKDGRQVFVARDQG